MRCSDRQALIQLNLFVLRKVACQRLSFVRTFFFKGLDCGIFSPETTSRKVAVMQRRNDIDLVTSASR